MYTAEQKHTLLRLAREAIAHYLAKGRFLAVPAAQVDPVLKEKRAAFVTLTIGGELRGCVGHLKPVQSLYLDVVENAVRAAFNDSRFSPLEIDELPQLEIEISVLTIPKKLQYSGKDDLLAKLQPPADGVILKKGRFEATYLPQVWTDLHDKTAFLSSLCGKAGLPANEWEKGKLEVSTYQVEKIKAA